MLRDWVWDERGEGGFPGRWVADLRFIEREVEVK